MSKETFLSIYREHITRPGSAELLAYLEKTDFFAAPASTRFHSSHDGGLCEHSLCVYSQLKRLHSIYPEIEASEESLAICGLLHDICKAGCYKIEMRNKKESGQWVQVPFYTFQENFPFGSHGGKSVFLLTRFIRPTIEEAVAINCHMGNEDGKYTVSASYEKYPLAWLLHVADEAATYLDEKKEEK